MSQDNRTEGSEPPVSTPPRALPRWSLVGVCLPTAAVLGYGAAVLPWSRMTAFAIVTGALAALHVAVALLAAARAGLLRPVLRALGFASLFYLTWIAQQVTGSALYVAEIYGALGKGVAAGLGAAVGLAALLTLPIGLWALATTAPSRPPRSLWAWLTGGAALFTAASGATWAQARAAELPVVDAPRAAITAALPEWSSLPPGPPGAALYHPSPIHCEAAPAPGQASVVVLYNDRRGDLRTECLQGTAADLPTRLGKRIASEAVRGPIKIDWLTSALPLRAHPGLLGPLVDVLSLRPGLDGVCHGNACLMPWQMITTGLFAAREATPYIPKMRLGFAIATVRATLDAGGGAELDGLTRITSESLLIDAGGKPHELRRMRARQARANAALVARAERTAEAFVLEAQRRDGTYRYELNAYANTATLDNPSIPRHAGTTLVLCELGSKRPEVEATIRRALQAQARYARRWDDRAALTYRRNQRVAGLGDSALGMIAFTACRARAGGSHDALIGELARFLIGMQRPDGSFRPGRDLRRGRDREGPTPIFAGGQAIMALTQLEEIMRALPPEQHAPFPPLPEVHAAVERAMDHVAGDYWPSPLRDFFFLKENWHCLAARAALRSHRHDGYERFCIDYASYKARLLLGPDDDVDLELEGGYGFGNIVPPHTGSSGGLGEAIGAAIALRVARGEDASAERARLERVLTFLVRQQAQPELCFACRSPVATGWFSGFMVGPTGRIDHIQHPWSALGHGAHALGWREHPPLGSSR